MEGNTCQYRAFSVVTEAHILKVDLTCEYRQCLCTSRITVLGGFFENFLRAFQTGERFRQLSTNLHNLHDGSDQEPHEQRIGEEATDGQCTRQNLARSDKHYNSAYHSEQHACRQSHD